MQGDEQLLWQGRPAPRCFIFRRWRQALFGLLVLSLSIWWQVVGWGLMQQGESVAWTVVPLPFVAVGIYLSVGQLLVARLEWERVFFALTSRQILVQCGFFRSRIICIPTNALSYQCLYPLGEQLGNLYLEAGTRRITLCCIEYPHELYRCLAAIIATESGNHKGLPLLNGTPK